MRFFFVILLTLTLILEISLTTLPLVFLMLLVLTAIFKDNFLFIMALIFGIFLDLMLFRTIGFSSIFFATAIFLVLLYQSKFEISTNSFIIFASFLGSFCFLLIYGITSNIIWETIISVILGLSMFKLLQRVNRIG
jgi:hypothetical protein